MAALIGYGAAGYFQPANRVEWGQKQQPISNQRNVNELKTAIAAMF